MTGSNQQSAVETAGDQVQTTSTETPMTSETITESGTAEQSTIEDEASEKQVSRHEKTTPSVQQTPTECTDCGNTELTKSEKHAEISCDDCGTIIETREFPQVAGWTRHTVKAREVTTSVTSNNDAGLSGNALGGTIDWRDMDGYGSSLSSLKRSQMHRLRDLDRRADTERAEQSNYKYALSEIRRMGAAIDAPRHVRDAASELYEEALEADALTGRSIEAVATVVLYAACEEKNISRDLSELAEISRADHLEITDTLAGLRQDIGLQDHGISVTTHVPTLCEELDVDDDVQEVAADILEGTVTEELLENASLIEHTAAAIYGASVRTGDLINQRKVADAADVPMRSVRACYQNHIEVAGFSAAY